MPFLLCFAGCSFYVYFLCFCCFISLPFLLCSAGCHVFFLFLVLLLLPCPFCVPLPAVLSLVSSSFFALLSLCWPFAIYLFLLLSSACTSPPLPPHRGFCKKKEGGGVFCCDNEENVTQPRASAAFSSSPWRVLSVFLVFIWLCLLSSLWCGLFLSFFCLCIVAESFVSVVVFSHLEMAGVCHGARGGFARATNREFLVAAFYSLFLFFCTNAASCFAYASSRKHTQCRVGYVAERALLCCRKHGGHTGKGSVASPSSRAGCPSRRPHQPQVMAMRSGGYTPEE